jgi:hypothetical protein
MQSIFGVRKPSCAFKFVSVNSALKFKSGAGAPQSKEPNGSEKKASAKPIKFKINRNS